MDTQYGRKESGAIGNPARRARLSEEPFAAVAANDARYGPRNTVPTVVLKAEFAQSYMAQPKISRRSFTSGGAIASAMPIII